MEAFVNDAIEQVDSGDVPFESVQWINSATGEVQHERPVDNMQRSEVLLSLLEAQLRADVPRQIRDAVSCERLDGLCCFPRHAKPRLAVRRGPHSAALLGGLCARGGEY